MHEKDLHISDELAQKSWSKMEGILDREMPVRKRRRAIVFLPYAAAILFLLAAGFVFSKYVNDHPDTPDNELQVLQEINEDKGTSASEEPNQWNELETSALETEQSTVYNEANKANSKLLPELNNKIGEPQEESIAAGQELAVAHEVISKSAEEINVPVLEETFITQSSATKEYVISEEADIASSGQNAETLIVEKRTALDLTALHSSFGLLAFDRSLPEGPDLAKMSSIEPVPEEKRQNSMHSFSLYGSPIMSGANSFAGVDLGLSYGISLNSDIGASLYSGISYKSQEWRSDFSRSNTNTAGGELADTEVNASTPSISLGGGKQVHADEFFAGLESTFHFESGILITGKIGSFQLGAGPKISHMLDATNQMAFGTATVASNYLLNSGYLRKTTWSVVAQASWPFSNRVSGHLAYHHRLSNLFEPIDVSQTGFNSASSLPLNLRDKYISLGMSFYLSR